MNIYLKINEQKASAKLSEAKNLFKEKKYEEVATLLYPDIESYAKDPWANAYTAFSLHKLTSDRNTNQKIYDLFKKAVELNPNEPKIFNLMGEFVRDKTSPSLAIDIFERALELNPNYTEAKYNLAWTYFDLGQIIPAIDLMFDLIKSDCKLKYLEDLIHYIYYDPRYNNIHYHKLACLFYDIYKQTYKPEKYNHSKDKYLKDKKTLVIGVFDAEYNSSPTWDFFEKIMTTIDKEKILFNFYVRPPSVIKEREPILQIKAKANKWEYLNKKTIKESAEIIYKDNVDILIDISGYVPSNMNFLEEEPNICIFAYKPAPVQISWYGFWGTTGFPEMDYLITSSESVPISQDQYFTEKIYRLNGAYTHFDIFQDLPEIKELPAIKNGYITFGSFNRSNKINFKTYDIWSQILHKVPNSKLQIKFVSDPKEYISTKILDAFKERGIDESRIEFNKVTKRQTGKEFISCYNNIDIAFDTIPFCGVTTAINALSMGVPVIATMEENSIVCGGVANLVKHLGLPELMATNYDEYVNIAVNLANDIERLQYYRNNLREIAKNSKLSIESYCETLEEAFRDIWIDCCTKAHSEMVQQ